MNDKTKILIVDDHVLVRMGYKTMLSYEQDVDIVGEAHDGGSAVRQALMHNPDVILMDLLLPDMSGAEATRQILEKRPETRILIVTSYAQSPEIAKAVRYGASGAVVKECSMRELLAAIRTVARGGSVFSAGIETAEETDTETLPLTEKQRSILMSIARGLNNNDIAIEHGISRNSVKDHIKAILQKLGVANRTEAAALAVRQNLFKHNHINGNHQ